MNPSLNLKNYLNCMLAIPRLSDADLALTLQARARGEAKALRLLEEYYLPRVVAWVLPYRGHGISLEALIEIGNRALLRGLRGLKSKDAVESADILENGVAKEVEGAIAFRA